MQTNSILKTMVNIITMPSAFVRPVVFLSSCCSLLLCSYFLISAPGPALFAAASRAYDADTDAAISARYNNLVERWKNSFKLELISLAADSTVALKFALMEYERATETSDPEARARKFENRLVAVPVLSMLMSLHTMQRTEEILTNATGIVAQNYLDLPSTNHEEPELRELLFRLWVVAIDASMLVEPLLGHQYEQLKKDLRSTFSLNSRIFVWWDGRTIERRAYINQIFMNYAFGDSNHCSSVNGSEATGQRASKRHYFLLARAIVEMAKDPDDQVPMNLVYNSALHKTCKDLVVRNDEHIEQEMVKEKLLTNLERLLKEEPELAVKVNRTLMSWEVRGVDFNFAKNKRC